MNAQIRHWFGIVGWFVRLLAGCWARKVIIPLFYHLAVLDYKPCYSQEPWQALYMIISVLFAKLYSSQGKGLRTNLLNEEQTFYF